MTLRDLIEASALPVEARGPDGAPLGVADPSDEESQLALGPLLLREVAASAEDQGRGLVSATLAPAQQAPIAQGEPALGYPGPVADEAAWSADWRSREPRATAKQAAAIRRSMALYLRVRRPGWPADPAQLTRQDASDALDLIRGLRGC